MPGDDVTAVDPRREGGRSVVAGRMVDGRPGRLGGVGDRVSALARRRAGKTPTPWSRPASLPVARQITDGPGGLYGPFGGRNPYVLIHAPLYYRLSALLAWPLSRAGLDPVDAARGAGRALSRARAAGHGGGRRPPGPARRRTARRAGWWAALLFAAVPILGGLPVTVRADMAGVALQTLGVLLVLSAFEGGPSRSGWISWGCAAMGLALCVKQHLVAAPAVSASLLLGAWVRGRVSGRSIVRGAAIALAVVAVVYGAEGLSTGGRAFQAGLRRRREPRACPPRRSWASGGRRFRRGRALEPWGRSGCSRPPAWRRSGHDPAGFAGRSRPSAPSCSSPPCCFTPRACFAAGATCRRPVRGHRLAAVDPRLCRGRASGRPRRSGRRGAHGLLWRRRRAGRLPLQVEYRVVDQLRPPGRGLRLRPDGPRPRACVRWTPRGPSWSFAPAALAVLAVPCLVWADASEDSLRARESGRPSRASSGGQGGDPREIFFVSRPDANLALGRPDLVYDDWLYPVFETLGLAERRSAWLGRALESGSVRYVAQRSAGRGHRGPGPEVSPTSGSSLRSASGRSTSGSRSFTGRPAVTRRRGGKSVQSGNRRPVPPGSPDFSRLVTSFGIIPRHRVLPVEGSAVRAAREVVEDGLLVVVAGGGPLARAAAGAVAMW